MDKFRGTDGQKRRRLMLMGEDHKSHSVIDGLIEELEDVVEEGRNDIEAYRYLKKLSETDRISKEQADKAMEVTCYSHLAGCCGPEKGCPIQLSVCEALGVDPVELFQVKKDAVDAWLRRKSKGGEVKRC